MKEPTVRLKTAARLAGKVLLALLLAELVLRATGALLLWHRLSRAPAAEPGAATILFVGESTVEGAGASPGNAFPAQLERRLAEAGLPVRYACLNYGLSGVTTRQMRAYFEDALIREKPAVVVLQAGFNRSLPSLWGLMGVTDESLASRGALRWAFLKMRELRLVQLAEALYLMTQARGAAWRGPAFAPAGRMFTYLYGNLRHDRAADPLLTLSDMETEADLARLAAVARARGVPAVFCGYFYPEPNVILRRAAQAGGAAYVDVETFYERARRAGREKELLAADGWHPGDRGYRLIALALFKTLLTEGLVPCEPRAKAERINSIEGEIEALLVGMD